MLWPRLSAGYATIAPGSVITSKLKVRAMETISQHRTIQYRHSANDNGSTTKPFELMRAVFELHYWEIAAHVNGSISSGKSDIYSASKWLLESLAAEAFPDLDSGAVYAAMADTGECSIGIVQSLRADRASQHGSVATQYCSQCGEGVQVVETADGGHRWTCRNGHAKTVYLATRKFVDWLSVVTLADELDIEPANGDHDRPEVESLNGDLLGQVETLPSGKVGAWLYGADPIPLDIGEYKNTRAAIQALADRYDNEYRAED